LELSRRRRDPQAYGARPHWGKLHFNRAEDIPSFCPRFRDFQAIRRKMDPASRFLNNHLRNLFA
jgi:D-arabinono-1,4-lactone oxidase